MSKDDGPLRKQRGDLRKGQQSGKEETANQFQYPSLLLDHV